MSTESASVFDGEAQEHRSVGRARNVADKLKIRTSARPGLFARCFEVKLELVKAGKLFLPGALTLAEVKPSPDKFAHAKRL